jgi:hypothetical protein
VWQSVTRRAVHEKRHKILSRLRASACLYVLRKEMRNGLRMWLLLLYVRLLPHRHVGDVHGYRVLLGEPDGCSLPCHPCAII